MVTRTLLAAATLLLAGHASSAQQGESFAERLDVNIVSVEIFANEKSGEPATGLVRKDFQVWEDDEKVDISHFSEFGAVSFPTSIVVFLDDTHMHQGDRDPVLDSLGEFVARRLESREAEAMVARYDGSTHIVLGFTDDAALFLEAIEDLKARPPLASESMKLERSVRDQANGLGGLSSLQAAFRGYGEILHRDTVNSLNALRLFTAALGTRDGGSAVLYVADGLAVSPLGEFMTNMKKASGAVGDSQYAAGQDASQPVQFQTRNADQRAPDPGDTSGLGVQSNSSGKTPRTFRRMPRSKPSLRSRTRATFASSRSAHRSSRPPVPTSATAPATARRA